MIKHNSVGPRMMTSRLEFWLVCVLIFAGSVVAPAATRTWTGASINQVGVPHDNFWTNPFNWQGTVVPSPGDDLVLIAGTQAASLNTFSPGTTFNSITISSHVAQGNAITLTAGITGAGGQLALVSIKLAADQSFMPNNKNNGLVIASAIDTNGKRLRLEGEGTLLLQGVISGTGGITQSGFDCQATLTANNTYTGVTRAEGLGLEIQGSQPSSPVEILGGNLTGNGTVGPVLVQTSRGSLDPGVGNGTAILNVSGNLAFTSGQGLLIVLINGTTPGSGHDQVNVVNGGTVNLASAELVLDMDFGFKPAPGTSFVIIKNDGTDPVQGNFLYLPEGAFVTVGNAAFSITYKGGDGNDVALVVPATWDGGGADDNWMTAANWVGDALPGPGAGLFFPSGAARQSNVNNYPNGTAFSGLLFDGLATNGGYNISGNSIALGGGGLACLFDSVASIQNNITLTAPCVFEGNRNCALDTTGTIDIGPYSLGVSVFSDSRVSISGALIGTGEIQMVGGTGELDLTGVAKTASGPIKVFGGNVLMKTSVSAPLFLDAGGTAETDDIAFEGTGSVGALTAGGASVTPGQGSLTGVLKVNGDAILAGNATIPTTLFITLKGATGNNQDKLVVNGAVKLQKAALSVLLGNGFAPGVGTSFVIVSNDGTDPVEGTFQSRPEGSTFVLSGITFAISYHGGDGNDVVLTVVAADPKPARPPSLANISTRLRVSTGENVLIGGLIATGSLNKKVIIRAIGPTLTDFGLPGALPDPTLELFLGDTLFASNDDWRASTQAADIENSGFAPGKDAEAAIIVSLVPGENYTAIVRGKDGQTGVAVVEAFDLDELAPAKLANISTRGFVNVDNNVMIAGLIVGPSGAQDLKVLVRALGPTLGDFGVGGFLRDPTLDLVNSSGTVIRSNNDWKDSQRAEIEAANLAPSHDEEAALIQTLPPGAYTAIVRGSGRTTGVGLVEVYNNP
jgi:hypothetical protein